MIKYIHNLFKARKEAGQLRGALLSMLEHYGFSPSCLATNEELAVIVMALSDGTREPAVTVNVCNKSISISVKRPTGEITYSRTGDLSTFKLHGVVHSLEHHRNLVDTFHHTAKQILDLHNS